MHLNYAHKCSTLSLPGTSGHEECAHIGGEIVPTRRMRKGTFDGRLQRVIIRADGDLVGSTPKEVNFRRTYDAAILSIHRAGEKIGPRGMHLLS